MWRFDCADLMESACTCTFFPKMFLQAVKTLVCDTKNKCESNVKWKNKDLFILPIRVLNRSRGTCWCVAARLTSFSALMSPNPKTSWTKTVMKTGMFYILTFISKEQSWLNHLYDRRNLIFWNSKFSKNKLNLKEYNDFW